MIALLDHRETSDRYQGELLREGKFRLAVCRDGIQWLIQQKTHAESLAGARWKSVGYVTTRKALTRLWLNNTGGIHPKLAQLPEFINRRTA